jgi:hypothetical protein
MPENLPSNTFDAEINETSMNFINKIDPSGRAIVNEEIKEYIRTLLKNNLSGELLLWD